MRYGVIQTYTEEMLYHEDVDPIRFNAYIDEKMIGGVLKAARDDLIDNIQDIKPNYERNDVRAKRLEVSIITREQEEMILAIVHNMRFGDFDKEMGAEAVRKIFNMTPTRDLSNINIRNMWKW